MSVDPTFILLFKNVAEWERWLEKNHTTSEGVWMRLAKKSSRLQSVTYADAVQVALCYGWIDSQVNKYDKDSYIQKFTPRRSKSIWSKINVGHIERLMREGKMKPAGLMQVEAAKADGRWAAAYDSPSTMEIPKDFLVELAKDKSAREFFQTLDKSNLYAINWRLQTAKKPQTRANRMKVIIAKLSKGEKLH